MKVKIKTWDKMVDEFGVDIDGVVRCRYTFIPLMEGGMPEDRIIDVKVNESGYMQWQGWSISDDMIEERFEGSDTKHQIQECLDTIEEDLHTAIQTTDNWLEVENHEATLEAVDTLRTLLQSCDII